jgi:hypothetical protein
MHDDLYVKAHDEESGIYTLNNPRAPKFKRFIGAFGWLDPQGDATAAQHCFLLGGIQTDDRMLVLDEHSGTMSELISGTVRLKDMFLVSDSWADATDSDLMMPLWLADGLTRYESLGQDPVGRELWVTPVEKYAHFRSRANVMVIHNVPPQTLASIHSGVSRLEKCSKAGTLLVHSRCSNVQWVMDQPRQSDVQNHPVFRALVYLLYGYERSQKSFVSEATDTTAPATVYRNLRKR